MKAARASGRALRAADLKPNGVSVSDHAEVVELIAVPNDESRRRKKLIGRRLYLAVIK